MTNAVVSTTSNVLAQVGGAFSRDLSNSQEIWNAAMIWLSQEGLDFAVNLIVSTVIFVVGWLAIKLVAKAVGKALGKGIKGNALLTKFCVSVITKTLWAFLIVTVLGRLGVNVGPLIAGLGVTGFILGFAFQESLGNLASGLMIAINAPFKVGDYVIVAGLEGTVFEVNMMATVLTTGDNKKIVVPNKSAWGAPITNFSAMATRRVDLKVGVAYDCDLAKAVRVILEALPKVPGVIAEPAPTVIVSSLDDSAITLLVRPWVKTADYWPTVSATNQMLVKALGEAGVSIPFPQVDVHLEK